MVARRWLTWLIVLGCVLVGTGLLTFQVSLWRARVAIEDRRHSAAERWLSVARCCWPANGEWHFLSVIVSRRAGEFERTKRELKNAFDLGWPSRELDRQQLLAYAQTGQFTQVGQRWSQLFQDKVLHRVQPYLVIVWLVKLALQTVTTQIVVATADTQHHL